MNQVSSSRPSAPPNSASSIITCRFQTVPPIPQLKAAIAISQDQPIEYLIYKIHQTILDETADAEYFHLLETANPSHRLVLELSDGILLLIIIHSRGATLYELLSDSCLLALPTLYFSPPFTDPKGCRAPIHEPCTIIEKEPILTFVTSPYVLPSMTCLILVPLFVSSVRLAPKPPINFTRSDRIQRPNLSSQSYYPLLLPSPINPSERFSSHVTQCPSTHQLNDSSTISTRKSNPPIPSDNISLPSSQGIFQVEQPDQPNRSTCIQNYPNTLPGSSLSLPTCDAIRDSNPHPISESQDIQLADANTFSDAKRFVSVLEDLSSTHDIHPHPANVPSSHKLTNPDSKPHLQTAEFLNHFSPQPSLPSQDNNSIPTGQESLEAPFQSNSQDIKPRREDLDESLQLSDAEVPRVRSHIAGLRKIAKRHYRSSSSSSSSNEAGFLDSSDESVCFSRHAQQLRSRGNKRKKRGSRALKQPGGRDENSGRRSPSPKRKSLPPRCSSDNHIEEITSFHRPSKIIDHDNASKTSRVNPELTRLPSSSTKNSRPRPRPIQSSSSTCSRHVAQVRVVIPPPSPSLPSPSQHGAGCNKTEVKSRLSRESAPLSFRDQSTTSNSDSTDSSQLDRKVSLSPHLDTNFKSPTRMNSAMSPVRETRSMYRIYVDDNLFKAASSKGPITIPYSSSSGLNGRSTLREVIRWIKLDPNSSWKMIIGDKVWMSNASFERIKRHDRPWGLLNGRIVQLDFTINLKSLGVFPIPNPRDLPSLRVQVFQQVAYSAKPESTQLIVLNQVKLPGMADLATRNNFVTASCQAKTKKYWRVVGANTSPKEICQCGCRYSSMRLGGMQLQCSHCRS